METGAFIGGIVLALFGVFIYGKIKESRERKKNRGTGGSSGGGGRPSRPGEPPRHIP